jgi:hypothetical protein
VIAGTFDGIFISLDSGASWEDFSEGLISREARCVVYDQSENRNIFAGTYGGGVYRYEGIYCSVNGRGMPGERDLCRLFPNYPNPFNPSTTVRFQIVDGMLGGGPIPVSLKIYDASGRLVKTLLDAYREPGIYTAVWHGDNDRGGRVSGGLYFCCLEAGTFAETRKMILLK